MNAMCSKCGKNPRVSENTARCTACNTLRNKELIVKAQDLPCSHCKKNKRLVGGRLCENCRHKIHRKSREKCKNNPCAVCKNHPRIGGKTQCRQCNRESWLKSIERNSYKLCTKCGMFQRKKWSTYCKKCNANAQLDSYLRRTYGISENEFNIMLKYQKHKCAICKTLFPKIRRKINVDHCHKTGIIRGLLCPSCNLLLGAAKDNPEILNNSLSYCKDSNSYLEVQFHNGRLT